MKIHILAFVALVSLVSCNRESDETAVLATTQLSFCGLKLSLPCSKKVHCDITPQELNYKWDNGFVKVEKRGELFFITCNGLSSVPVAPDSFIEINEEGLATVRSPNQNNQKQTEQGGAPNPLPAE